MLRKSIVIMALLLTLGLSLYFSLIFGHFFTIYPSDVWPPSLGQIYWSYCNQPSINDLIHYLSGPAPFPKWAAEELLRRSSDPAVKQALLDSMDKSDPTRYYAINFLLFKLGDQRKERMKELLSAVKSGQYYDKIQMAAFFDESDAWYSCQFEGLLASDNTDTRRFAIAAMCRYLYLPEALSTVIGVLDSSPENERIFTLECMRIAIREDRSLSKNEELRTALISQLRDIDRGAAYAALFIMKESYASDNIVSRSIIDSMNSQDKHTIVDEGLFSYELDVLGSTGSLPVVVSGASRYTRADSEIVRKAAQYAIGFAIWRAVRFPLLCIGLLVATFVVWRRFKKRANKVPMTY